MMRREFSLIIIAALFGFMGGWSATYLLTPTDVTAQVGARFPLTTTGLTIINQAGQPRANLTLWDGEHPALIFSDNTCDRRASLIVTPQKQAALPLFGKDCELRYTLRSQSTSPLSAGASEMRVNDIQPGSAEKLYGTWIAEDVDSKMGEVKIKLTFREDGPVTILAWSDIPFVGKVKDLRESYELHGDTISSKAIRGGTSVRYSFEGEQLVLQFEDRKVVRFRRE